SDLSCFCDRSAFVCIVTFLPLDFFSTRHASHRGLHSFPTRRSSDLRRRQHGHGTCHARDRDDTFGGDFEALMNFLDAEKADPVRSEETRLNSSHGSISYAVFCLKKKKETIISQT